MSVLETYTRFQEETGSSVDYDKVEWFLKKTRKLPKLPDEDLLTKVTINGYDISVVKKNLLGRLAASKRFPLKREDSCSFFVNKKNWQVYVEDNKGTGSVYKWWKRSSLSDSVSDGLDLLERYAKKPGYLSNLEDVFKIPMTTVEICSLRLHGHTVGKKVYRLFILDVFYISDKHQTLYDGKELCCSVSLRKEHSLYG